MKPTKEEMDTIVRLNEEGKLRIDPQFSTPEMLPSSLAALITHMRIAWDEENDNSQLRVSVVGIELGGRVVSFGVASLKGFDTFWVTTPNGIKEIVPTKELTGKR